MLHDRPDRRFSLPRCVPPLGLAIGLAAGLALPVPAALGGDRVTVRIDEELAPAGGDGRLILFLIAADDRSLARARPFNGPFLSRPQPIASMPVHGLRPGDTVELDGDGPGFPGPLSSLSGQYRVQPVLRISADERSHQAPGNAYGPEVLIEFEEGRDDEFELVVDRLFTAPELPDDEFVDWVELISPLLSRHAGRPVLHRAGVVLPPGYHDDDARRWPAVYIVPGFGGTHRSALNYRRMVRTPGAMEIAPNAVYVVLDPESPIGHHGFVDSAANGPRGTALIDELIPHLESRFRLASEPAARIITGHSSGGWSSLWLQLRHPEVFGACWSSAPDPIDFTAFQATDLYSDPTLYTDADGEETPSMRRAVGPGLDKVLLTVREEMGMEHAMSPDGRSGQQWDTWEAMFSPTDPLSGHVRPLCDPVTGAIDHGLVAAEWSRYDIARTVLSDWERYGPLLRDRVRLAIGGRDSYYLNRAVERLRDAVAARQADGDAADRDGADAPVEPENELTILGGPGYIWILPQATHGSVVPQTTLRWNREMIEHLRAAGLHE